MRQSVSDVAQLVLEATDLGIWEWDFVADHVTCSHISERILGLAPPYGHRLEDFRALLHPEDRSHVEHLVRRSHDPSTDGRYETECRIIRPSDGARRWVAARGRSCFDERGRLVRMLGSVRDITAQKQAEAQLLDSELQMRTALDYLPLPVSIYDSKRRYAYLNLAALELAGKRPLEDYVGRYPEEMYGSERSQHFLPHLLAAYATGRRQTFHLNGSSGSGRRLATIASYVPIADTDGTIWQVVGIIHDLPPVRSGF